MARPRSFSIFVFALFCAAPVLAAPTYPVTARLTLAPREEQRCLSLDQGTDCGVLEIARSAFAAQVGHMFKTVGAPDLQLVLSMKRAELARVSGLQVELVIRVRLLSPSGELLDEMEVYGEGLMLDPLPASLLHAQQAAADNAASAFEREYANSTKIGDYLVGKKVAPSSAVAVPERGDKNIWGAIGGNLVVGGGDDGTATAPSVRFAVSYRRFFAQAMLSHYTSSFEGVQGSGSGGRGSQIAIKADSDLSTIDLGLDLGVVFYLTRTIELRLGPGLHYLTGDGTYNGPVSASSSFSTASPTAFASLSTSFIAFHNGPRILLGAEARGYFFNTVDLPAAGRSVPVASSSFGIFVGLEWSSSSYAGGAQ